MSESPKPQHALQALQQQYPEYDSKVYGFTLMALQKVVEDIGEKRHLQAAELANGVVELAHDEFGPLASEVLQSWGLETTEDLGEVVFAMVETGIMGARKEDRQADFEELFDLHQRLQQEYEIGQALQGPDTSTAFGR